MAGIELIMRKILFLLLLVFILPAFAWAQIDSNSIRLQDEGSTLGQIKVLNCVGAGITCTRAAAVGTATVAGGGGGGGPTLAATTAIQTVNGNAYRDITSLTFSLAANTTYLFEFFIAFQSAAATTGFGFSVNGPAQSLLHYYVHYQTTANAATTGDVTVRKDVTYDAMAATTATITANVNLTTHIMGVVRTTAVGTLAARVRSELADNNLTVRVGSVGLLTTF